MGQPGDYRTVGRFLSRLYCSLNVVSILRLLAWAPGTDLLVGSAGTRISSRGFLPPVLVSRSGVTPPERRIRPLRDPSSVRVLYVVGSSSVARQRRPDRVRAILDTWAKSGQVRSVLCDWLHSLLSFPLIRTKVGAFSRPVRCL